MKGEQILVVMQIVCMLLNRDGAGKYLFKVSVKRLKRFETLQYCNDDNFGYITYAEGPIYQHKSNMSFQKI